MQQLKLYSYIIIALILIYFIMSNDDILVYSIFTYNKQIEESNKIFELYEYTNNYLKDNYNNKTEIEKLDYVANSIIDSSMTDYDKIKTIHDYLVFILSYDDLAVLNNKVTNSDNQPGVVLVTNRAVCAGYTYTFKALCDIVDIQCNIIIGNVKQNEEYIKHAWNQVLLNGEWYNIDVTFDDPLNNFNSNTIYYTYFLVSDDFLGDRSDIHPYKGELHNCNFNYYEYNKIH